MKVAIAGGHGKIALLLTKLLTDGGHEVVGLVRKPEQADDVAAAGGVASVVDIEHTTATQLADHLTGVDACVFAAGAGPHSGIDRKWTVDRDGAIVFAAAAQLVGAFRFLVVSAMGTENGDPDSDDVFTVYLAAKAQADDAVRESALDWTIVRPGRLTDDPPTGKVAVGHDLEVGSIPRADVAAVLAGCLEQRTTVRTTFDVVGGSTPIGPALASLDGGAVV